MANLTELPQWDAGVYRLETTDPAEGGESGKANAPLKNLANRTTWLKQHVDGLENASLIPAATETLAGKVELATVAEAAAGADTVRAVTPAGVAAAVAGKLNASGSAPTYACRAWANFNGNGTPAIRAAGNFSSITDYGPGDFGVNFAVPMPDANYSAQATISFPTDTHTGTSDGVALYVNSYTTSSFRIFAGRDDGSDIDPFVCSVAVFR